VFTLKQQSKHEKTVFKIQTRRSRRCQTSLPVPPPGELDKTYASSLIMPVRSIMCKKWRRRQNRNISHCHCHQRRTEPRPRVTSGESLVKFKLVVFEIRERTDKQTIKQTHIHIRWSQYFTPLPWQTNNKN